jgi:uncharacterized phosphosugar-binding protein
MLASRYFDKVDEYLASAMNQLDTVKKAGSTIARAVLNGKKVYVMDRYDIVDAEIVEHPSGLALFRSYKTYENALGKDDIFILAAYFPDDENDRSLLEQVRSRGAFIITISPQGALSQAADISLINNDSDNGVITIPEVNQHFCPVSGIVNVTLAWAVAAETVTALLEQGVQPSVYWGEFLAGAEGKNSDARKRFLSLGY